MRKKWVTGRGILQKQQLQKESGIWKDTPAFLRITGMKNKRGEAPKYCLNFLQGKGRLKAEIQWLCSRNCLLWILISREPAVCSSLPDSTRSSTPGDRVWALLCLLPFPLPRRIKCPPPVQSTIPSLVSSYTLRRKRGYDQGLTRWMSSP